MKSKVPLFLSLALCGLFIAVSTAFSQGTAFTYQGRLNDGTNPANGRYDLIFITYDAALAGTQRGPIITNSPTAVANGLFTATLNFGLGVFTGSNLWLEVGVRTNGSAGEFTTLSPRQLVLPTPYAIMANAASNLLGTLPAMQLSGTVGNGQLANNSLTVNAGVGLSGGGIVALGGSTTLANAGVLTVAGNSDISVSMASGAAALGTTATSTDTPSRIVKRDLSGNFSAASITLDGSLNLPATSANAGVIYQSGSTLLHTYGSQNFFAGPGAGTLTMTGSRNTASGYHSLYSNTTGNNNAANGSWALNSNTTGSGNTANGSLALYSTTNGSFNTASGYQSLYSNTNGGLNTADGSWALFSNTSGTGNTGNGLEALYSNTTGHNNTANGSWALFSNTTADCNTANGGSALYSNITGTFNTASGYHSLYSNTTGNNNTASGYQSLYSNTTGSENTANGDMALNFNTTGSNNTANGFVALYLNTTGNNNTAYGVSALASSSGSGNTAVGFQALTGYPLSGSNNIALGYNAGGNLSYGDNDIYIGNNGNAAESGIIRIGTPGTHSSTILAGTVSVNVLQILGGSDVAEPFDISTKDIPKGAVVVIDDENTGRLKMSDRAYDKHVAGIVSGANGINPGLTLRQEGVTEGGQNVALSGRVYALGDDSNGPIKPGDLLTTSDNPGRCMKVTDHAKAQGAVLGKAMSSLASGKGMVLVLVSLQ